MGSSVSLKESPTHVEFNLEIMGCVKKDKSIGCFISYCPALDVYSQGDTENKAIENLKEAIRLFIENCYERGTLNKALQELGFKLAEHTVEKQITTAQQKRFNNIRKINVPIPFIVNSAVQRECHV